MKNDLLFPRLQKILQRLRHIKRTKISFKKIDLQHTNENEWGVNHCVVETKIHVQYWVADIWKWSVSLLQDLFFYSLCFLGEWQAATFSRCTKLPISNLIYDNRTLYLQVATRRGDNQNQIIVMQMFWGFHRGCLFRLWFFGLGHIQKKLHFEGAYCLHPQDWIVQ